MHTSSVFKSNIKPLTTQLDCINMLQNLRWFSRVIHFCRWEFQLYFHRKFVVFPWSLSNIWLTLWLWSEANKWHPLAPLNLLTFVFAFLKHPAKRCVIKARLLHHHLPCRLSQICAHFKANRFTKCQTNVCRCDINVDLGQGKAREVINKAGVLWHHIWVAGVTGTDGEMHAVKRKCMCACVYLWSKWQRCFMDNSFYEAVIQVAVS